MKPIIIQSPLYFLIDSACQRHQFKERNYVMTNKLTYTGDLDSNKVRSVTDCTTHYTSAEQRK